MLPTRRKFLKQLGAGAGVVVFGSVFDRHAFAATAGLKRSTPEAEGVSSAAIQAVSRRSRADQKRIPEHHHRPPRQGNRRRLVETVCRGISAHHVFDEQELHLDRRGACGYRRKAERRRQGDVLLPARSPAADQRQSRGPSGQASAHHVDRPREGTHRHHDHPGELGARLSRLADPPRSGKPLRLQ